MLIRAATLALGLFLATPANAQFIPTVTGPITGGERGRPYAAAIQDLAKAGYTESEFFFEGVAQTFHPTALQPLTTDGVWTVEAGDRKPYKTRMLVRRPAGAAKFNGTVILEWLQATASFDKDVSWNWHHEEYLRRGYAWVGISAQHSSIDANAQDTPYKSPDVAKFRSLVQWDPARYGTLRVPHDDFAYDIFTQAARLVGPDRPGGANGAVDPLGGLTVEKIIAVGNTESAAHLVTYYNAIQPRARAIDAFLAESRYDLPARLADGVPIPQQVHLRTDLAAPIIVLNTDSNVVRHAPHRQPDAANYRLWEVAGTSHTNAFWAPFMVAHMARDFGIPGGTCVMPNEVPMEAVGNAAIFALNRWIRGGAPAPAARPVALFGTPPKIERDPFGNSLGGIRLRHVQVPIARYSETPNPGCSGGGGITQPFAPAKLAQLYGSKAAWLAKFAAATAATEKAGFLLPEDAEKILAWAKDRPEF